MKENRDIQENSHFPELIREVMPYQKMIKQKRH